MKAAQNPFVLVFVKFGVFIEMTIAKSTGLQGNSLPGGGKKEALVRGCFRIKGYYATQSCENLTDE